MIEAILLPFLEPLDLVKFASLSRNFRNLLDPSNHKCINLKNLLPITTRSPLSDTHLASLGQTDLIFKDLLEILKDLQHGLAELPKIHFGDNYRRYDKEAGVHEYIAYAGLRESLNTDDFRYYDRKCPGTLIKDKPCLVLKNTWNMDPRGTIENVYLPENDKIEIFVCIYHHYEHNFQMDANFTVKICDMDFLKQDLKEPNWVTLYETCWPILYPKVEIRKGQSHFRQMVARITNIPPEYKGKYVAFDICIWSLDGKQGAKKGWHFEAVSVMVNPKINILKDKRLAL